MQYSIYYICRLWSYHWHFYNWIFSFYVRNSTLLHLPPLRFHCSEDAGIEPRTVATLALTARRSTTRLDLVHSRLDLIHARLDLIHPRLDLIHPRLDLIPFLSSTFRRKTRVEKRMWVLQSRKLKKILLYSKGLVAIA